MGIVLSTTMTVLGGMAAVLLVAVLVFVVVRRAGAGLGTSHSVAAKRLTLVLTASLILAFAVSYVTAARASNSQTFALSGAERWTVGPFLYVTFAALLLTIPGRTGLQDAVTGLLRSPSGAIAAVVVITGFVGLLFEATAPAQTAQGLALILGFALFFTVGAATRDWDDSARRLFTGVIVIAGALTFLATGLGSFPALGVPACIAAVALLRSTTLPTPVRIAAAAGGAGLLLEVYETSSTSNDPSAGLQLQMGMAGAIVVIALLPLRLRAVAGVVAVAGIVVAIASSPLAQITMGGLAHDPDLTIAQRGYETQAVWASVSSSPVTLLFGIGPGATVDLSRSPDAATLLASGRDLAHVPSVHLLTSHLLLKAGIVGLLWFVAILVQLVMLTVGELRQSRPGAFPVLLLCLPWCGIAAATPAATFVFSNPMCALGFGLLSGRAVQRRLKAARPVVVHVPRPVPVRADAATVVPRPVLVLPGDAQGTTEVELVRHEPRGARSVPTRTIELPTLVPSQRGSRAARRGSSR